MARVEVEQPKDRSLGGLLVVCEDPPRLTSKLMPFGVLKHRATREEPLLPDGVSLHMLVWKSFC